MEDIDNITKTIKEDNSINKIEDMDNITQV
jgi:hypothetical protein